MATYSITIWRFSADIHTKLDLYSTYHSLCNSGFPPIFECDSFPSHSGYHVYHHETDDNTVSVSPDKKTITAAYPSSCLGNGESLFHLAYALLECQFQEAGFATSHAACVRLGTEGALLVGKIGSGKTSAAIELCRRHGGRLVGNDLCIVGLSGEKPVVLTGTRFFLLRYESVKRNLPFLSHLFEANKRDTWMNKVPVSPKEIGIDICPDAVTIAGVYLLHVDNSQEELYVENGDNLVTRLYLNEDFSRYIRMTCSTVLTGENYDFSGYVPSFDCEAYFWKRVNLMNMLLYGLGITYVSGPLSEVTSWIVNDMNQGGPKK